MRILSVNKFLYPKGGCETHMLGLAAAVAQLGHEVRYFGMEHPANVTPPDRTTTVPLVDYRQLDGLHSRVAAFGRMVFSTDAYRRISELVQGWRPDVAHAHNVYHQLSPSVLVAMKRAGVPCVLTAHDFKLVCPSYSLYDGRSTCFNCRGHSYWRMLTTGCSRAGVVGALALTIESYLHHFLRLYEQSLDLIIAPSQFLRDRLVEGGFAASKIRVLHNAIEVARCRPDFVPGEYLFFVGRLSYEKGLATLIRAAALAPEVPLVLAGDGPLRQTLEQQAADLPNVRFLGSVPPARVVELARASRAIVLASEATENCPLCVLEGFAVGKPAIGTQVGGVPELIEPEVTGLLVPPGDAERLAAAMLRMWMDPDLCRECGVRARQRVEERHDMRSYTATVTHIYRSLAGHSLAANTPARDATDRRAANPDPKLVETIP